MTNEEIIVLAREAGAMFDHMTWVERDLAPVFERYTTLVLEEAALKCEEYQDPYCSAAMAEIIREMK